MGRSVFEDLDKKKEKLLKSTNDDKDLKTTSIKTVEAAGLGLAGEGLGIVNWLANNFPAVDHFLSPKQKEEAKAEEKARFKWVKILKEDPGTGAVWALHVVTTPIRLQVEGGEAIKDFLHGRREATARRAAGGLQVVGEVAIADGLGELAEIGEIGGGAFALDAGEGAFGLDTLNSIGLTSESVPSHAGAALVKYDARAAATQMRGYGITLYDEEIARALQAQTQNPCLESQVAVHGSCLQGRRLRRNRNGISR